MSAGSVTLGLDGDIAWAIVQATAAARTETARIQEVRARQAAYERAVARVRAEERSVRWGVVRAYALGATVGVAGTAFVLAIAWGHL